MLNCEMCGMRSAAGSTLHITGSYDVNGVLQEETDALCDQCYDVYTRLVRSEMPNRCSDALRILKNLVIRVRNGDIR